MQLCREQDRWIEHDRRRQGFQNKRPNCREVLNYERARTKMWLIFNLVSLYLNINPQEWQKECRYISIEYSLRTIQPQSWKIETVSATLCVRGMKNRASI